MLTAPREVIPKTFGKLHPSDFFVPTYQIIFRVLRTMFAAQEAIDPITVHQTLTDEKLFDSALGQAAVAELLTSFATHLNADAYIDLVLRESNRRRAVFESQERIREAEEESAKVCSVSKNYHYRCNEWIYFAEE